ncbi:putative toxin-antitoxin system toxin component, PIN family [Crocosphaera sp. UHCC 0190]|uniref:putative toxin-antitoxin system toxin component, PIN family n=1 Tax=Crocosphaera sp. UHCC 0190 TaxID=3110246 RepID=UPI002B1F32BF|nr:putative toxin-antitoxin system toxin component, PIN family [Crocosphaera sp. UHCC 0190]MEA5511492.1 putative toxin-antitoxin system toxin component, PIN family [Crocosphaera sp. UHCC 0190]
MLCYHLILQIFLEEVIEAVEKITITEFITDCRDAKDNIYLDVAINGLADLLITGDKDLLILHPYRKKLPILTPSNFVKYEL